MKIIEGIVKISVRELVEFVLRSGSISSGVMSSNRAVIGTLAHKKIQQNAEGDYEAEVRLVHECDIEGIMYIVEGRADGIVKDLVSITIDEIKTTTTSLDLIDENYNYLHWAQAKCYAYFYAKENKLTEMQVRLTYYNIDTKEIKYLHRNFFFSELEAFFVQLLNKYNVWMKFYMAWIKERDGSLKLLSFPFETYRAGQRQMAVSVYRSIQQSEMLYISAPTGIGKTISTLFPALKAMGEGYSRKIFYLTAKTITRTVAEEAVSRLYRQGARIKTVTLTAKEKICFLEKSNCNPEYCKWANGHYDRVDEAVYDMITHENVFTRDQVESYANKYEVCPFELSLDLCTWADVVICDYNYMFDPTVALKRFIDNKEFVLLVDEAHNLVDRAREMYSAGVSKKRCLQARKSLGKKHGTIIKELRKINEYLLDVRKNYIEVSGNYITLDPPKELYQIVRRFLGACDNKFQSEGLNNFPYDLVEFYFEAFNFGKIFEFYDEHYVTYADVSGSEVWFKMFCLDPSVALKSITKNCRSVIFFSATLLPIDYYKYMLGGEEAKAIAFSSPFKTEHALRLVGRDVSTRYKDRELSYEKIVSYIEEVTRYKVGHYMVFFPSYKYMIDVYEHLILERDEEKSSYDLYIQAANMDEEAKEAFLGHFIPNPTRTTINFCVLGGIFSEGIDLTEDRLIGVIVVGVGLPQIGIERELIRDYFDKDNKDGYHYAYTYPGMNKVLQAVGRLIRTEVDKGIIMLIDDRFATRLYSELFPLEFKGRKLVSNHQIQPLVESFWHKQSEC